MSEGASERGYQWMIPNRKSSSGALFHLHQHQYNGLTYTVVWMKGGFKPDEGGFFFFPDEKGIFSLEFCEYFMCCSSKVLI